MYPFNYIVLYSIIKTKLIKLVTHKRIAVKISELIRTICFNSFNCILLYVSDKTVN